MHIRIQDLKKRFRYEWIFRNLSLELAPEQTYTIIGANGSGKSTLLQIIAGLLSPSGGKIEYQLADKQLSIEDLYQHLVMAAPYLELIEEFSLQELIQFHLNFKKIRGGLNAQELIERMYLEKSKDKLIKYFSSGMKQRLKLGLAFYSEASLLLLDEPTSNLDVQGIRWYKEEIQRNTSGRLVIICSNQKHEYDFCENIIDIMEYKAKPKHPK